MAACNSTTSTAYELQISLKHSKPLVRHDFLIPSDFSLDDLHQIIQTTMGCQNNHPHVFIANKKQYGPAELDGVINEEQVTLQDVLSKRGSKILYESFANRRLYEIKLDDIIKDMRWD